MPNNLDNKEVFLLADYEFMQKAFELQFNHFMGVFYFWVAVVYAPTTAGILTNLGLEGSRKLTGFGILCILVSLIGLFLSVKMFDIRRSQLRYAQKMNEIRTHFWRTYKIEENDKLIPLGKNDDLAKIARTDFGMHMAWVMSLTHGFLLSVGAYLVLRRLSELPLMLLLSILLGAILLGINFWLYFRFVVKKLSTTEIEKSL